MKKLLLVGWLMWLLSGASAFATESSCPEGYKETITKSGHGRTQCYIDTDTDTDTDTLGEPQDEAGVGADVVLWQNDTEKLKMIEEVTAEYRYDMDNETHAVYGVVRVNLWDKLKELKKDKTVE